MVSKTMYTGFLLLIGYTFALSGTVSVGYAAEQKTRDFSVYEAIRPTKETPNPHSPFWITTQQLGFVAGQELKGTTRGAVFVVDLQTKNVRTILMQYVFYPTFLQKLNLLSFVAVGKHDGLTLFTKSIKQNHLREYEFGAFSPSWSPDNKKVVFADLSYDSDLYVADVDTGKVEPLDDLGRGEETEGTEGPDWSPNGREIVYVGWDKSSRIPDSGYVPKISRLYKFYLRLRKYQRLTGGSFQDRWPAYSPSGKEIAFVSNRSQNPELWLMNSDGKGIRRLTDMGKRGYQVGGEKPAWSPDQRKIAFSVIPTTKPPRRGGFPFENSTIWILEVGKVR
ncbi:MAG: PD40 domain-containing protein [Deltaproteobacteria bacterium]|nr:PD40 domain-containing protein [Deltaproteobacteria bacterium]